MGVQRELVGKLCPAVLAVGALGYLLSGCSETDWKLQNRPPELAAIGAQSVTEGQRISFAIAASDADVGDPLVLWVENQPPNSEFADSGNGRGSFSFSPNYGQQGTSYPVFKVSDGHAMDSEVVAVAVADVEYTHHAGIITQNESWTAVDNPHLVAGDIDVQDGAVITILPGSIIYFVEGKRIRVGYASPGGLVALGTADQKIRFTSVMPNPTPGIWDGLTFSANCLSLSKLEHCIIEYGGGNGFGNVFVDDGAVSITNCSIRESSTSGIFFGGEGNSPNFDGNVIAANHLYPVAVSCNYLGRLGGSSLTGNARDTLIVRGRLVNTSATWDTLGVPLRITELFEVAGGATLTIVGGHRLIFDKSAGITVGSTSAGTLVAEGTAEQPILFTASAANPIPGSWEGLAFYGSAGAGCVLAHCTVEYGAQNQPANVVVKDAEIAIRNTTIRRSKQYGAYFDGAGRFSIFDDNILTTNTLQPLVIGAAYAGRLPGSTSYTGNGTDQIVLMGGALVENSTWANLGIPYYVDTGQVRIGNGLTLTIVPGDSVLFGADAGITVGQSTAGTLIADGTDGRIVLTANNPTVLWSGIRFMSHTEGNSVLKNCTISYGGSARGDANVWLIDCQATVSACRISNGGKDGVRFEGAAYATDFVGNTITANAGFPVTIDCDNVGRLSPNNDYTGNRENGFQIRGSAILSSATWSDPGVPMIIGSVITVNSGVQLTLAPGLTLRFKRATGINVSANGTLAADGTANQIVLTNSPTPDDLEPNWNGLVFLPGASSSSVLKNCLIHKAGLESTGAGKRPGSVHVDSCTISLTDCYIDSSNFYGVYLTGTACLNSFQGNTVVGSQSYPVRVPGGSAGCLGPNNSLTGNGAPAGSRDAIQIGTSPVTSNATWPKLPVPYDVDSLVFSGATLTITPGVTIRTARRGYFRFESTSSLIANGTPADSITFTSTNTSSTANNWGYLRLQGSGGSASFVQYCNLEFGGNFLSNPRGILWISSCTPTVMHNRISNSRSCAIYLDGSPVPSKAQLSADNTIDGTICP